jgi:hypothetical protein
MTAKTSRAMARPRPPCRWAIPEDQGQGGQDGADAKGPVVTIWSFPRAHFERMACAGYHLWSLDQPRSDIGVRASRRVSWDRMSTAAGKRPPPIGGQFSLTS